MANKGPTYGLSRACQLKTNAKFDMNLAKEALTWIEEVTGRNLESPRGDFKDQYDVQEALKDGQALCELMNIIFPGSIKKVNTSKLAFKQRENIEMFVMACQRNGMKDVDTFATDDLYEGKSMYTVINCIHQLGSLARKAGFDGNTIGVKLADANKREFTEEQLIASKQIISLQYGSNKGASQAGMTAPGTSRHM
ncbi:PREDICTED: calponin-3-like [Priapulus caudatus]|uniref:Transgelin n=1 Tax=Priapulus caudatus TaxID=37621 RepID=A0ABM1EY39_PRICU|nr:PREDICTED: calponin-3-like [Priapulus caudatus]